MRHGAARLIKRALDLNRLLLEFAALSKCKLSSESLWDKYHHRSAYSNHETSNFKDLQIPKLEAEHAKKDLTTIP